MRSEYGTGMAGVVHPMPAGNVTPDVEAALRKCTQNVLDASDGIKPTKLRALNKDVGIGRAEHDCIASRRGRCGLSGFASLSALALASPKALNPVRFPEEENHRELDRLPGVTKVFAAKDEGRCAAAPPPPPPCLPLDHECVRVYFVLVMGIPTSVTRSSTMCAPRCLSSATRPARSARPSKVP